MFMMYFAFSASAVWEKCYYYNAYFKLGDTDAVGTLPSHTVWLRSSRCRTQTQNNLILSPRLLAAALCHLWDHHAPSAPCFPSGCYNKVPEAEWLIYNRNLFCIVLESGGMRSRSQRDSHEGLLLGCRLPTSWIFTKRMAERAQESSLGSL